MNAGLEPTVWHDLFVAYATACAALLGLFYVAISIHIDELEGHPLELNRAQAGLHGLLVGLVISLLVLIPAQPLPWLGTELIAAEVAWLVVAIPASRRMLAGVRMPPMFGMNAAVSFIAVGLVLAAGISLVLDVGPGLYLVAPSIFATLLIGSYFAWTVLFVRRNKEQPPRT